MKVSRSTALQRRMPSPVGHFRNQTRVLRSISILPNTDQVKLRGLRPLFILFSAALVLETDTGSHLRFTRDKRMERPYYTRCILRSCVFYLSIKESRVKFRSLSYP